MSEKLTLNTARMRRLVHPDDLAIAVTSLRQVRAGTLPTFSTEFRIRHLYGHWIWLRCHGRAQKDEAGLSKAGCSARSPTSRRPRTRKKW